MSQRQRAQRFVYGERGSLDTIPALLDYMGNSKLFRHSYVRPFGESEGKPIDSTISWSVGNTAAFYRLVSNSCVEAKRTEQDAVIDGIDGVVIDYVLDGTYEIITPSGSITLRSGETSLVQSTIEVTARSSHIRMASLFLPRTRLVEEMGSDLLDPTFRLQRLDPEPISPFLAAHMRLLFETYGTIPNDVFQIAVEHAALLSVELLRCKIGGDHQASSTVVSGATAYLQNNFRRHFLKPKHVAQALGISRAKLYCEFADHDLTVAGYLRDLRLRHFVEHLRSTEVGAIGRLAWDCGLAMRASEFSRMFKRIYGMTPKEARTALIEGRQVAVHR